jgi:mannose-6-phosphate isomerase-like protein (cupin superfamily)
MFAENLNKVILQNSNFRKVLYTGQNSQLVAMCIPAGGEIGEEVHPSTDQILFFNSGEAQAILDGESKNIGSNDVVFVPAGTRHNFKNIGDQDLKLYTIYSPPEHPDGTIHATKEDALREELDTTNWEEK